MKLKKYLSKRNPNTTPEPMVRHSKGELEALHFCVQKHAARRLHFDFRLEFQGVLLSWAIPKGPSLNPQDKRLAIKVEDHPLDYQYFEGIIPKGNYGAGKVEIWDKGSFFVPQTHSKRESEQSIHKGLLKGHLDIYLQGEKLQGEFILQKLNKSEEDNNWLLIKKEDAYATNDKIQFTDQVEKPKKRNTDKMPQFVKPMLATLVDKPFDDEDWLFEVKWDGYRALAYMGHNQVKLLSRAQHLWNQKFPTIVQDLRKFSGSCILDGELVVLDEKGKSHFQLMQNYQKTAEGNLFFYVFDLLYKDGKDLRDLTLIERKKNLKEYLEQMSAPRIRFSDHVSSQGIAFFREVAKNNLEGIIGKKKTSSYQSRRSSDWVKIKTLNRQEVVIGGFTSPKGSRKKFGALLVGVYNDDQDLIYCGHVGGGFDEKLLTDVFDKLTPIVQQKCPFKDTPKPNTPAKWVNPRLICEVKFAEWTKDNIMRQPIFQGLREDKNPRAVKKEIPLAPNEKKSLNSTSKKQGLSLTNLDKIYWPKEKYTKGQLIDYYQSMAPAMLPYLKNHPIMMHRYPQGIESEGFYQKDIGSSHPNSIPTAKIKQEGKIIEYLLINNITALLYAVNLGSIDIHPFLASYNHLEYPDFCVIDLDPTNISFKYVIEVALQLHQILEECQIKHYCKTSGGKGLHICIPLKGQYDFEQSRQFAEIISLCVHQMLPKITSMERDPKKRQKKIYLDCLQNRFGQTLVSPYSIRPRPFATASTPLDWEEVDQDLDPTQFNIQTLPGRLKAKGDIFKPVLGKGINMEISLKMVEKYMKKKL